jgi:ribosomal protein S18 acetylase RimI-like enzyme
MDFISAIESNLYQFYEFTARRGDLELIKEHDFSWVRNQKSAWPNWIFRLNRDQLTEEKFIASLAARIKKQEIPPYLITLEPDNAREFYALAEKYGLRQIMRWTGMAITKDEYLAAPSSHVYEDIIHVRDKESLKDWLHVVNSALYSSNSLVTELLEKLYLEDPFRLYLGYENDDPVSTSLSFQKSSVAGLYMIATMENHREKGYGSGLTRYAMERCFQNKSECIILHASAMGEKVYRKIGLREYCKFGILWMVGKDYR